MIFRIMTIATLILAAGASSSCRSKYNIRDVDPTKPGRVRTIGPESQDVLQLTDQMSRSILQTPRIKNAVAPPTIVLLPMENNTRFPFNQEVFNSNLKASLNKLGGGKQFIFVSRDLWEDIKKEREMKREGELDYDPNLRTRSQLGGDYFLRGRADGLSRASTEGQGEMITYTFKLVDAESAEEVWEDIFITNKEGKDDLLYR